MVVVGFGLKDPVYSVARESAFDPPLLTPLLLALLVDAVFSEALLNKQNTLVVL